MKKMRLVGVVLAATMLFGGALFSHPAVADTLSEVRERGYIKCGVAGNLPGFSSVNDKGERIGFQVDYCKALAAAVLGDATKVRFTPLNPRVRFTQLAAGSVDLHSGHATYTFSRDASLGLDFVGVYLYDGQGFMVPKKLGVKSVSELDGATICMTQGSTSELNVADYFGTHKMKYQSIVFKDGDEPRRAYEAGRCDVWTTDRSIIASNGLALKNRNDHIILPEVISRSPIGPVVRHGDNRWKDIAFWTLNALILADEKGVTSKNVDRVKETSKDGEVLRLLGTKSELGKLLGLSNQWAYNIIKQIGNYGEIWDRHLGPNSRLGLPRGPNNLWTVGGLLYAPAFR